MIGERAIKLTKEEAIERITGEHLDQVLHPQFAGPGPQGADQGPGRVPGRGRGPGLPHRRRRPGGRRAGREGGPGPQRDLARGRPRHAGRRGDPHRPGRPGQPRRRGGPGLGQAGRGRGRGRADRPPRPSRWATSWSTRATGSPSTAPPGWWCWARCRWSRAETPPEFETVLGWADEIRAGHLGVRANADNGPDAANARQHGAEGIGLCRTEHMFLAEDRLPIVRRMILASTPAEEEARPRGAAGGPAGRLRGDPRGHGRPAGDRPAPRPAPARVPARHRELAIKEATVGLTEEERRLYEAAKEWHEFNPMLGHPGGAARGHQARPLRHAGAGPHGGGPRPGGRRRAPDRRDHDPPDRLPRGDGPGPVVGGGGHRRGPGGLLGARARVPDGQGGQGARRVRSRSSSAP